jgi:hypothetical protein
VEKTFVTVLRAAASPPHRRDSARRIVHFRRLGITADAMEGGVMTRAAHARGRDAPMVFYLSRAQAAAADKFGKDMFAPFERAFNADPTQKGKKWAAGAYWSGRVELRFVVRADGVAAFAFSAGALPSDRWGAKCSGPQTMALGEAACAPPASGDPGRAYAICGTAAAAVKAFHARHAGKYEVRFPDDSGMTCYLGDGTSYQAKLVALDGSGQTLAAWDPSDERMDFCVM